MTLRLRPLNKEFSAPASATSGLGGYDLEGQRKRKLNAALAPFGFEVSRGVLRQIKRTTLRLRRCVQGTEAPVSLYLPTVLRKAAPVRNPASVDQKAHEAATSPFNLRPEPSEKQKTSGQYKKGSFKIGRRQVRIENPAGSLRRPEWPELKSHYGYFPGTRGADGDPVDVFVRVGTPLDYDGPAYVVNQYVGGDYDEAKVMMGWHDWESARDAYAVNFTPDWDGLRSAVELSLEQLDDWLDNGEPDQELDANAAKLITPPATRAWVDGGMNEARVVTKQYLINRLLPA